MVDNLREAPLTWYITGVGGFIGSHVLEELLRLGQTVIGVDNFKTGAIKNLEEVEKNTHPNDWKRFLFFEETSQS